MDSAGRLKLCVVRQGRSGTVELEEDVFQAFRDLCENDDEESIKTARRLTRYFERYAELGRDSLDDDHLKVEDRVKIKGTKERVLVLAFRAGSWRVYGIEKGRRFIGLTYDASKKKRKANPRLLSKCAEMALLVV
jgi:hypothetical protein